MLEIPYLVNIQHVRVKELAEIIIVDILMSEGRESP